MRSKISIPGLTVMLAMSTVIILLPATRASAQTEKVLFSFNVVDGWEPYAGLVFDSAGNLYGTTSQGGAFNYGNVFELKPTAGGGWEEYVIHTFNAAVNDGAEPLSNLIFDAKGNLYGTTGGGGEYVGGIAFELSPAADGSWRETVLHNFGTKHQKDGVGPGSNLIIDQVGNLYGTTAMGGTGLCRDPSGITITGCGTVFELSPLAGGDWTEKVLYSFDAKQLGAGDLPSGLIFDAAGNLYSTTQFSRPGEGNVFEFSHMADGAWAGNILHTFFGLKYGFDPIAGLTIDAAGNLYGTTSAGGNPGCDEDCGAVFELMPSPGGGWLFKWLHGFANNGVDGYAPYSGLILDTAGNLYGTTTSGGTGCDGAGCGTVFELSPKADGSWSEKVLYSFNDIDGSDGEVPYGSLVLDDLGNLYGTTRYGGAYNAGAVFEITP
jgi:uncharacterized repeat protein (TIGR03803 family)